MQPKIISFMLVSYCALGATDYFGSVWLIRPAERAKKEAGTLKDTLAPKAHTRHVLKSAHRSVAS